MRAISTRAFERLVIQAGKTVLVYFHAPGCPACGGMKTVAASAAKDLGISVLSVNVSRNDALADKHDVMGVPTLALFSGGAEVGRIVGETSKGVVLKELKGFL